MSYGFTVQDFINAGAEQEALNIPAFTNTYYHGQVAEYLYARKKGALPFIEGASIDAQDKEPYFFPSYLPIGYLSGKPWEMKCIRSELWHDDIPYYTLKKYFTPANVQISYYYDGYLILATYNPILQKIYYFKAPTAALLYVTGKPIPNDIIEWIDRNEIRERDG